MLVRTQKVDDALVILLEGRLMSEQEGSAIRADIAKAGSAGQVKFIIDLNGVEFVNSACLNFLVASRNMIESSGGRLVLCNTPEQLVRLLRVTKLDSLFQVAGRTGDALQLLRGGMGPAI